MRKIYTSLLVLAMFLTGTTTKAQDLELTENSTQDYQRDWGNDICDFEMSTIASAFEADAATLAADIEAFNAADPDDYQVDDNSGKTFWVETTVAGTSYPNADQGYAAEQNGFWMKEDGTPCNYGDEGYAWYVFFTVSEQNDSLLLHYGQLPNHFVDGANLKTTLKLHYNSKVVTVNLNLTVNPKPVVAEIVTELSKLNIVKDYELKIDLTQGKSHEGITKSATLDGIYDALGTTAAEFDALVADQTFTQVVKEVEVSGETAYEWQDQLELPAEAAGGAWFGRYTRYDEATGEETFLEMNAPHAWTTNATFYTQNITLSEGEFSILTGQYPGTLKEGDTDYAYLYIINEDKAARVKVYVEITAPAPIDPNDFKQLGEETIQVTAVVNDSYGTKAFEIDAEKIATVLGCETSDFDDIYAWESEGVISENHTEGSGGFYYAENGFIENWGSNASHFIALPSTTSFREGKFTIGQMRGHFTDITEPKTVLSYLIYQSTAGYYVVTVEYTVKPDEGTDEKPDAQFEIKAVQEIEMQIKPASSYYGNMEEEDKLKMQKNLGIDKIKELIGDGTYEVYGLRAPAAADKQPTLVTSTGYTPNTGFDGGFWMAMPNENLGNEYQSTSFVGSWGTNAYGIEWILADGIFGFDQIPNQRSVGDEFKSTFYWVNTDNNQAIKYLLTVKYVENPEEVADLETIGEENVIIVVSNETMNADGFFAEANDLSAACTALGIDPSEAESLRWYVPTVGGGWNETTPEIEVTIFDENGAIIVWDDSGDLPEYAFSVAYDEGAFIASFGANDVPETVNYRTKLAVRDGNKRYVFNIAICDPETATGILGINAAGKANNVYDMSGRLVRRNATSVNGLAKGVYMINGTKVLVK